MSKRIEHFCAFCSLTYRSYRQRHTGWKEFTLASVFSVVLMWFVWKDVHIFGFILWGSLLAMSEIVLRIRWRSAVKCPHCGFDPVLYKSSPERASEVVREFLDQRREDPNYLLRPQPVLPLRPPKGSRAENQRSREAEL